MTSKQKMAALLKSYPRKVRQLEQLCHELEDPPRVSGYDVIDCLSMGSPVIGGGKSGQISDRTMMIALQYQEEAQKLNAETAAQIKGELQTLVAEIARLERYISLLNERQKEIIQRRYFEGQSWSDIEAELGLSRGTLNAERSRALDTLVSMYQFIESFNGDDSGGAEVDDQKWN